MPIETDWAVWKYPIPLADTFTVVMPGDARALSVQIQGRCVCLWAQVQPKAPMRARRFRMIGTGHSITAAEEAWLTFVGTFQLEEGALVFHLFEQITEA